MEGGPPGRQGWEGAGRPNERLAVPHLGGGRSRGAANPSAGAGKGAASALPSLEALLTEGGEVAGEGRSPSGRTARPGERSSLRRWQRQLTVCGSELAHKAAGDPPTRRFLAGGLLRAAEATPEAPLVDRLAASPAGLCRDERHGMAKGALRWAIHDTRGDQGAFNVGTPGLPSSIRVGES
eukprot:14260246-Alexandrium_andersonii.AAC.1